MYCRNCGNIIGENQTFCSSCGTKKLDETSTNNCTTHQVDNNTNQVINNINQNNNPGNPTVENNNTVNNATPGINNHNNATSTSPATQAVNNNNTNPKSSNKKMTPIIIILLIAGAVSICLIIFLVMTVFRIISDSSNKLICTSPEGNITIMYNEDEIVGYTASKMTYDLDEQKEYAKQVGVEAYLDEFNEWFENNTSGICKRNGAQDSSSTHDNEKDPTLNTTASDGEGLVIGDKKYGYLNVPNNWVPFKDVSDTTALQYTYASVYIVTMDYIRDNPNKNTAKEYAQSFMYKKKNDSTVSGVTGSTVKIGKNKEYDAYQVYMYYPSDGTYLVTYWFESEDGIIRYLALEGPAELSGTKITDYLYIPESFSLNK